METLNVVFDFGEVYCTEEMPEEMMISYTRHPPRVVHTSLTLSTDRMGKRAIDESADAAARVDVLISSRSVCLITAAPGLSLLNCIQDHHVSL